MTMLRDSALSLLTSHVPDPQGRNLLTPELLRALVQFAPTPRGRDNVCYEIIGCYSATTREADSSMLDALANRYRTILLIPMAVQGGRAPSATTHSSRPPFEPDTVIDATTIDKAKSDPHTLKAVALYRDGFRSLMTAKRDIDAVIESLVEGDLGVDDTTITQAAHIVPLALAHASNGPLETRNRPDIWELIGRFYGEDLLDGLAGSDINRLENVLTLGKLEHKFFGRLECWFEATDELHTYIVRGRRDIKSIYTKDRLVRFGTTHDQIPLPSSRYIALHAACAQVINACGMGKEIDRIIRDIEELSELPEDGGSDAVVFALH